MALVKQKDAPSLLHVYSYNENNYDQNPHCIDYIHSPIAVHLDRYIFEAKEQEHIVQIYDIQMSKIVGKF